MAGARYPGTERHESSAARAKKNKKLEEMKRRWSLAHDEGGRSELGVRERLELANEINKLEKELED